MERVLQGESRLQQSKAPPALTATEPASIFTLKSLLFPVMSAVGLWISVLYWRQSLHGPYFLLMVIGFLTTGEFFEVAQLSREVHNHALWGSLAGIVLRWAALMMFVLALLHLSELSGSFDRRVLYTWGIITAPILWASELILRSAVAREARSDRLRRAVIVGVTELGLRLEARIKSDPSLHVKVAGFFEDREPGRLPPGTTQKVIGKPSSLPHYIKSQNISVVYVTLPMSRHPRIVDLLDGLRDSTASVYFVPDLNVFDLVQARLDNIGGVPLIAVCESPFYGATGMAKRCLDILVAIVLLIVCAPLLLALALGVRLTSAGPVLFRQRRYGLDGREILIYKFRSMRVIEDGESHYRQVTPDDERVTKFGALLRRLSLDELPQLLNVLQGSLSMVGPRPHAIAVNEQYRKLIPGYMLRHKIKPGITGWAQINGLRGGDDLESMKKRVEFDLDYLNHWSVGLDLAIICRTAITVWRDGSAY